MGTQGSKDTILAPTDNHMKVQSELYANQTLRFSYKSKCQKPQHAESDEADFRARRAQIRIQARERPPGQDGRTRVTETQKWPYSVHGVLTIKFVGELYSGTATMIGPNLVITAAHNVYDSRTKTEVRVSDLHFHPAANGKLLPFGVVNVLAFYYPDEYKTPQKEDYAILILEKDIGHQTGFFGLNALEISEAKNKKINITGYPADKVAGKPKCFEMWGMEGSISHIDEDLISYQIDTCIGQAGGGIWYEENGEYYVIGVHVRKNGDYKQGTFLNSQRLERIQGWIKSFYSKKENIQFLSVDSGNNQIEEKEGETQSKSNFKPVQSSDSKSNITGGEITEDPDFCHGSTVTI